jgi:hypothetical protein
LVAVSLPSASRPPTTTGLPTALTGPFGYQRATLISPVGVNVSVAASNA